MSTTCMCSDFFLIGVQVQTISCYHRHEIYRQLSLNVDFNVLVDQTVFRYSTRSCLEGIIPSLILFDVGHSGNGSSVHTNYQSCR